MTTFGSGSGSRAAIEVRQDTRCEVRATVLGLFELAVNRISVVSAAMKARQLLAMMVLNRTRIVQSHTIERELWEKAPRNEVSVIQNSVMQIRKNRP